MSTLSHKLVAVCLVAAFSMVMYGCGGGGGSSSVPDPTDMMPEEPTGPTADEQAAADAAMTAANDAATAANDAATAANDAVSAATLAPTMAASDAAAAATAAAMAATAAAAAVDATDSATVDAANAAAMAANMAATTANDAADALNMAESDAQDAAEAARIAAYEAAKVAATTAAGTKRDAIQTENDQPTDAGLGGTGVDTVTMTIERDRDGTTVTIADSALAGEDDPKFTQMMDLGGGTTMHTRVMEANDDGEVVEEVVMVTTEIAAPKATAFAMVANQALNARDLDTDTDGPDDDDLADNDWSALTVVTGSASLVMSSAFTADSRATLTFDFDADGTMSVDEAFEAPGTYNGAMGTYRCNGTADCTVTIADTDTATDGDQLGVTALSEGWIFTPDSGATSDVADADFMDYGFWLKRTTDEDGVLTYNEVETFARSSVARSTTITSVTGRATYSGDALGVYVHSVVNPDGTEASATSGHFTADVELTAHFAQTVDDQATDNVDEEGQIAPNLLNSLSGTINDFTLSGHDQGPGWSVSLEQADTDGTDTHVDAGVAKGGGADGSYIADFHGPTADDTQPHSVVGEFNAFFSNGSVAGGFGASKND